MSPVEHVADRAAGYNVPATVVDGSDVIATWDAMSTAIDRARTGGGPTLIEAMTYRFRGHTRYDTMAYIPPGEVESHVNNDPVIRFRAWLIGQGHATDQQLSRLEEMAVEDVADTWAFAQDSPYPDTGELLADVFASEAAV
jgi:pyruvate dehydrogenase E1 component alpha subunit